jgi:hypothetical protein
VSSLSIAISVIQDIRFFFLPLRKSLKSLACFSKVDAKREGKRLDIFVSKTKQDPWVSSVKR